MRHGWITALIVLVAAAPPASAQRGDRDAPSDTWKYMAGKYDKNGDGKIAKTEYDRGAEKFKRLDRNGDGVLTAADFPSRTGRRGNRRRGMRDRMLKRFFTRFVAADGKKTISAKDWKAFLSRVDPDGDGDVEPDDITDDPRGRRMMRFVTRMLDENDDEAIQVAELKSAFEKLDKDHDGRLVESEFFMERPGRGRDGRRGRGRDGERRGRAARTKLPKQGDVAPDFDLPILGKKKKTLKLSSFAGKKPVALIFGSYT